LAEPVPEQLSHAAERWDAMNIAVRRGEPASRAEWAKAWLREYRCNCNYLALLSADHVDDSELRRAWLAWWHAACACREALARLEEPASDPRM
jgi:hypothetical protein